MVSRIESSKGVVTLFLGVILTFQLCTVANAQVTYNMGSGVIEPTDYVDGIPVYDITQMDEYWYFLEIDCQEIIVNFDAEFWWGWIYICSNGCTDPDCSGPVLNFGPNASAGVIWAFPRSNLNLYGGSVDQFVQVDPGSQVTIYGDVFDVDSQGVITTYGPGTVIDGTNETLLISAYDVWYDNDVPNSTPRFSGAVAISAGASVLLDTEVTEPQVYIYEVLIDVIPWTNPSVINMCSRYRLPVAVLSDEFFDATQLPPETVEFAGAGVTVWRKGRYAACPWDVNKDGLKDMVFFFNRKDLLLEEGVKEATLTLTSQLMIDDNLYTITGSDNVYVKWPRKKTPRYWWKRWSRGKMKCKVYKSSRGK